MEFDTIVYSMAYRGLFGGNPLTIWDAPVDVVLKMYQYVRFMSVYDETSMILNRSKDK